MPSSWTCVSGHGAELARTCWPASVTIPSCTTPVILCSADLPARPAHGNAVLAPGCALLPKPFDLNDLLTVVRALTGGPS